MAIYQRFDFGSKRSRWMLLQAPQEVTKPVHKDLTSNSDHLHPHIVHQRVFSVAEQDWRDYICYLDDELRMLEEKASYVNVDAVSECDYSITFADAQKLQRLRKRIVKAREILDFSVEVALSCEVHWQNVRSCSESDAEQGSFNVGAFVSRIKLHKRAVEAIQEQAEGVGALLSQILSHRNQDAIIKSNEALNTNSNVMRELALASKRENELMAVLGGKSQRDSHTIKILTIVALIYLPAALVAEIFNSNLVQITSKEHSVASGSHLTLSPSFWVYPVITCGLMLITFLPTSWLLYRSEWRKFIEDIAG